MIVKKLKPHVTSFSEVIKQYQHGHPVCVGGEIKQIIVLSDMLSEEAGAEIGDLGVYLTLDDGIGQINVVLPTEAYNKFKEEHNIQVGMLVLAVGKVMHLTTGRYTDKGKYLGINHPERTTRIAAYHIDLVPELEEGGN